MSIKNETVNGVKWTATSTAVLGILQLTQLVILARLLDSASFGLMSMALVIVGFAQAFSDLGISNAIIHNKNNSREQLSSLYWLNLFIGIIIFIAINLVNPLVVKFYNQPEIKDVLFWISLVFVITPLGQQFNILYQKELRFKMIASVEMVSNFAGTLVAIYTAYIGYEVFSIVNGLLTMTTLKSVFYFVAGVKRWPPLLRFKTEGLKSYVQFGSFQMGERALNFLNSNLPYIVIGKVLGAEALGYYSLAFQIISVPVMKINPIVTNVLMPVFSKIQDDNDQIKRGYFKALSILGFINFPIYLGLLGVAPVLMPAVFGHHWTDAVILVQILTGVGLLRSIANPVGSLLVAKGYAKLGFQFNAIKTFIQIPGILIGAYMGGLLGVTFAYLALQVFDFLFGYYKLIRVLIGDCFKEYILCHKPTFIISSIMCMFVLSMGSWLHQRVEEHALLALQISLGGVLFLVLQFTFNSGSIHSLLDVVRQKKSKTVPLRG